MIQRTKLPPLSEHQTKCLEKFRVFEISLDELRRCLKGIVKFDFDAADGTRWMETHFEVPEPGVLITKKHLEDALAKKRDGLITDRQVIEWATMILHNHAYELDEKDEDLLADWLNDISFDLRPWMPDGGD